MTSRPIELWRIFPAVEAPPICDQFLTGVVISLQERFSSNADAMVMTSLRNYLKLHVVTVS